MGGDGNTDVGVDLTAKVGRRIRGKERVTLPKCGRTFRSINVLRIGALLSNQRPPCACLVQSKHPTRAIVRQPDELVDRLEMKPSALAASIEKRLLPRVSKMRMAGIEPRFSRDFRNIAVQTDAEFRVRHLCVFCRATFGP